MSEMVVAPGQSTHKVRHNLPAIPAPMKAVMDSQRLYIFNVGPWQHPVPMGSLGVFLIPACPEGQKYSASVTFQGKPGIPAIVPQTIVEAVDGATVKYGWDFSCDGERLAKNIIGITGFSHPSADLTQYGVFLASGPVPTDEELAGANAKFEALLDKRVQEADQKFEVNGGMEMGDNGKSYPGITKDDVYAVNRLGLDRPYARKNQKMIPCEGCGHPVSPNAVRCHHTGCGAILNEEKARKLFPHLFQTEPEKRGPGRPRKDDAA